MGNTLKAQFWHWQHSLYPHNISAFTLSCAVQNFKSLAVSANDLDVFRSLKDIHEIVLYQYIITTSTWRCMENNFPDHLKILIFSTQKLELKYSVLNKPKWRVVGIRLPCLAYGTLCLKKTDAYLLITLLLNKTKQKFLLEFFFTLKVTVYGGRHESLFCLIIFDSVLEWKVNIIS